MMTDSDVFEIRVLKNEGFRGITLPIMHVLHGTAAAVSANYLTPFFIANRPYQVVSVTVRYEVASSAAETFNLVKVPSGTAPASGTDLLTTEIALNGTANTNISGAISTVTGVAILSTGDALALETSGTPTDCSGLTLSVLLKAI